MVFVALAIRSLGSGLQAPAVPALLPQLVPPDRLMRVAGVQSTVQSVVMLASPAVAGALYAMARLEIIFFVDVLTAAIAIAILSAIPIAAHARAAQPQSTSPLDDLRAGFDYVSRTPFVRSMLRFFAVVMFLAVPVAILSPLMVARSYGPEVWRLTVTEVAFSGGMTAGGLLVAAWGGFKSRLLTLAVSCGVLGVLQALAGLGEPFGVFLALMALLGLVLPLYNSASMVMLQERVPSDLQGRVFGYVNLVIVAAMPMGSLVLGPLADLVRIETLMLITGSAMAVLGVLLWFDRNLHPHPAALPRTDSAGGGPPGDALHP
jgi:DHA3 family macrolide efflux protein-like MFS transporter